MTSSPPPPAEFDSYAPQYNAGMEIGVKRLLGPSALLFLEQKLEILLAEMRRSDRFRQAPLRHLDFGCGAGDFLSLIARRNLGWASEGCDISEGMLDETRRRWGSALRDIPLWPILPDSFPAARYHLITAVCVFHHIPPPEWLQTLQRLRAALLPGGLLALFEHNPWNPLTLSIVRRTQIDQHAVLLSPPVARRHIADAGFAPPRSRFFLFAPPASDSSGPRKTSSPPSPSAASTPSSPPGTPPDPALSICLPIPVSSHCPHARPHTPSHMGKRPRPLVDSAARRLRPRPRRNAPRPSA